MPKEAAWQCSVKCARAHDETYVRKAFQAPKFAERFSGRNFTLTFAVALRGISVQGDRWDFSAQHGKDRLDEEETEGDFMWSHWAPDFSTLAPLAVPGPLRDSQNPEGSSQG